MGRLTPDGILPRDRLLPELIAASGFLIGQRVKSELSQLVVQTRKPLQRFSGGSHFELQR